MGSNWKKIKLKSPGQGRVIWHGRQWCIIRRRLVHDGLIRVCARALGKDKRDASRTRWRTLGTYHCFFISSFLFFLPDVPSHRSLPPPPSDRRLYTAVRPLLSARACARRNTVSGPCPRSAAANFSSCLRRRNVRYFNVHTRIHVRAYNVVV